MTARSAIPAPVADALVDAELKAFDRNLRRWRTSVSLRRRTPEAPVTINPRTLTERVATRLTEITKDAS